MAVKKSTQVDYSKAINGQQSSFGYNYAGEVAPERVSFQLNLSKVDAESKELYNGSMSLGVNMENRAAAKESILASVNAAFDEIENILVNYQNPEVQ